VEKGQPILELHADDPSRLERARQALLDAISIGDEAPAPTPLVLERVG
jgi:thymidine phosphorylase